MIGIYKWEKFKQHLNSTLEDSLLEKSYYDVTLVSDEKTEFQAHKLILSAYSSVFKSLLFDNPHPNPLIYLRNVSHQELQAILQFMYLGKMELDQSRILELRKATEDLKIFHLSEALIKKSKATDNSSYTCKSFEKSKDKENIENKSCSTT